jgi:GNAT superfamily N-acetyltransferase
MTTIRPVRTDEFDPWATLFRGYREFYRFAPDDAVVERVWAWIHDPEHETHALVAIDADGALVGLAHYRRFARPSTGTVGLWLDDLFTDPDRRGGGIGKSLIDEISTIGAGDGCSIVRWITASDNATAQRLYDGIATKTAWVTYDRPCR